MKLLSKICNNALINFQWYLRENSFCIRYTKYIILEFPRNCLKHFFFAVIYFFNHSLRPSQKICLFPISDRMSKNSGKRYRMAFCVVKENISSRTCPNQRMYKVFIVVKYNAFIAVKFSITRLLLES